MKHHSIPKVWVIIQGPVYSPGRNFKTTAELALNQFKDESDLIIHFDSTATILNNVKELQKKGISVIYSGWLGDCPDHLADELKTLKAGVVLLNPNDAPSLPNDSSTHEKREFIGPLAKNNKAKQYYSLLKGIEAIGNEVAESIVVKIRSDIKIDFDQLLSEIERNAEKLQSKSMLIQFFKCFEQSSVPSIWLQDFWFAARGDVLRAIASDLYSRALSGNSYYESPHRDLAIAILRYYWPSLSIVNHKKKSLKKQLKEFFDKPSISYPLTVVKELAQRYNQQRNTMLLKKKMVTLEKKNLLLPASKEIQYSMVWRGDRYVDVVESKFYQAEEKLSKYSQK